MNFLVARDSFRLGAHAAVAPKGASGALGATGYGAVLGYAGGDYAMTARYARGEDHKATLSVSHDASDAVTFASVCEYDVEKMSTPKEAVSMKMGGVCRMDARTEFRGMLDNAGDVSLSYAQVLNPSLRLTASAQLNMDFMNASGSTATKFGMGLDLGDI
jgi:hypothetical protein